MTGTRQKCRSVQLTVAPSCLGWQTGPGGSAKPFVREGSHVTAKLDFGVPGSVSLSLPFAGTCSLALRCNGTQTRAVPVWTRHLSPSQVSEEKLLGQGVVGDQEGP